MPHLSTWLTAPLLGATLWSPDTQLFAFEPRPGFPAFVLLLLLYLCLECPLISLLSLYRYNLGTAFKSLLKGHFFQLFPDITIPCYSLEFPYCQVLTFILTLSYALYIVFP